MKLYHAPGACSLAPHVALREAGLPVDLVRVDLRARKTASGEDYSAINPKGYVPALQLDDGTLLTEIAALLQYIADRVPEKKLAPAAGTMERYRLQEWLHFIGTEIHKAFSPLFNPATTDEQRKAALERISGRLDFVAKHLENRPYLLGEAFTVADAYLYTVLRWTRRTGPELQKWPALEAYVQRVSERDGVKAALQAEGLEK